MHRILSLFVAFFVLPAPPAVAAEGERRVALIVGNSAYSQAPVVSPIVYATAPEQVALDGSGRNGTFTKHLLRALHTPDVHIGDIVLDVRVAVMQETGSQQVPWSESSLTRRIYLAGKAMQSVSMSDSSQTASDTVATSTVDMALQNEDSNNKTSDYENSMLTAYRIAAEQGDAIAQSRSGYIFDTGRSTLEDKTLARSWYEKAADQGYPRAMYNLGELYEFGRGIERSVVKAGRLYEASTLHGDVQAISALRRIKSLTDTSVQ